jgi:beta-glucosidase
MTYTIGCTTTGAIDKQARVESDGFAYRDLNGNGQLDPYEDSRLSTEERIDDLLPRMTLQEKAGLMFQSIIEVGADGDLATATPMSKFSPLVFVHDKLMNHFNILAVKDVRETVRWQNAMQAQAASTRLGIPVTLSSDPR